MKERLTMTHRELDRLHVIRKILERRLSWSQGATLLRLCRSRIGALCARVRREGARGVLLVYIDDATSRILYAEFVEVEDTLTLLRTTRIYLRRYGRPIAFYVDKDSIYAINRQATIEEELRDLGPITQFTRAMGELDIQVLGANSPQAKGRVERSFDTHQDRLVKELRWAGISTPEAANRFLWDVYLPAPNERFALPPASGVDAHRPLRTFVNRLDSILSVQTERQLANDFILRFQNRFFQVLPHKPLRLRPKNKVVLEFRLEGSIHLRFKDVYLPFKTPPKPSPKVRLLRPIPALLKPARAPHRPPLNHSWRNHQDPALYEAGVRA